MVCRFLALLFFLSRELRNKPCARIGGYETYREYVPFKATVGMFAGASFIRASGIQVDYRVQKIFEWFSDHGLSLSGHCAEDLWFVTRAYMHFSLDEVVAKRHVSMFSHLGDRVLAIVVSSRCLAAMLSPADCASYDGRTKNEVLAALLHRTGMREFCDVHGLSVSSKANADIFESVVGVLSIHFSYDQVLKFLDVTGFGLPKPVLQPVIEKISQFPGLTSIQYQNALRFASEGKLG